MSSTEKPPTPAEPDYSSVDWIPLFREAVEKHSYLVYEPARKGKKEQIIDVTSLNVFLQVYDKLNEEQRQKMIEKTKNHPALLCGFVWQLVSRAKKKR